MTIDMWVNNMIQYRLLHIPTGEWLRNSEKGTETVDVSCEPYHTRFRYLAKFKLWYLFKYKKIIYLLDDSKTALLSYNKSEFEVVAVNVHFGFCGETEGGIARKAVCKQ